MKRIVLLLLLVAALLQAGELLRLEDSVDAMGTTYTVVAYSEDQQRLEQGVQAALAEARRLELMLSNYRAGSEWSKVNRDAASRPVVVSPEMFKLLSACLEFSRQSEGTFDVSVSPLMKVWGLETPSKPARKLLIGIGVTAKQDM